MQALVTLIIVVGFVALVAFSTNAALIAIGAAVVAALVIEALREYRDDAHGTRGK
jgi:hypothetical protein